MLVCAWGNKLGIAHRPNMFVRILKMPSLGNEVSLNNTTVGKCGLFLLIWSIHLTNSRWRDFSRHLELQQSKVTTIVQPWKLEKINVTAELIINCKIKTNTTGPQLVSGTSIYNFRQKNCIVVSSVYSTKSKLINEDYSPNKITSCYKSAFKTVLQEVL